MTLTIRPFEASDLTAVRALHDRTPPDQQPYVGQVQPWPSELDDIASNYYVFWVVCDDGAEHDRHVVAMAGLKSVHSDVPGEVRQGRADLVRLDTMRVAVEWQRKGLGRMLVGTAVGLASSRGWGAIILETTPEQVGAVALYEATGFRLVARSRIEWEGRLFNQVWFEQGLQPGDSL